jgi:hypothetical protein
MKCKWFNKKEELISQKIPIHSYNKKNKDDKFLNLIKLKFLIIKKKLIN